MYVRVEDVAQYLNEYLCIKEFLNDPKTVRETFENLLRDYFFVDNEGYLIEECSEVLKNGYELFKKQAINTSEELNVSDELEEKLTEEDFKLCDYLVSEVLNKAIKAPIEEKDTNVTYLTIPFDGDKTVLDYDTGSSVNNPSGFNVPNGPLQLKIPVPGSSHKKAYEFLLNELSGDGGLESRTKYVKMQNDVDLSNKKRLRSEGSCFVLKDVDATTRIPFIVYYDNANDKTYIIVLGFLKKDGQKDQKLQNQYDFRAKYVLDLIKQGKFDFEKAEKAYKDFKNTLISLKNGKKVMKAANIYVELLNLIQKELEKMVV